ncbi:N,N-dimethylformamidase beta subunit family domain-containing protein [Streptomyces sp. 4F14]|uniref:N,N-dimethylformamidase beta subunit family domain-containing protein n=1 Tax=Streptomyces sp. 4F14 TaxID=3394380 RepID=UPI003A8831E4
MSREAEEGRALDHGNPPPDHHEPAPTHGDPGPDPALGHEVPAPGRPALDLGHEDPALGHPTPTPDDPTPEELPAPPPPGTPTPRWQSGALAHAVSDPFALGPLPWLRGSETYFEDGRIVPWYVDPTPQHTPRVPPPRDKEFPTGAPRSADDVHRQIKGFTSPGAVTPGEAIDFHITVDPPQRFTVDVYRIGHYNGEGAAKITTSPRLSGIVQPPPLTADRTVSCHHWWLSWRLQVPTYWNVGAYVAVLTTADGYRSHIPFTVRDTRPADLLLLLPDVTWQAYNLYPEDGSTGASLYHAWDDKGRLLGEADAATTVSFDRPYAGAGLPLHVGHAYDVIRWAERYGYDLAYADARDLHAGNVDPTRYRGLLFPGHDEYWSANMRRTAELARDSGTSLVFLSANTMYWQVELGPSPSGAPARLLTCRKRKGPGKSLLWREIDRPEQQLLGIQYAGRVPTPRPMIVRNAHHWLWEATGAHEGDEIEHLVAGEADRYFPRTPLPLHEERVLLAHSPYDNTAGTRRHQETSLYRAPSGALVFASGTFAWSPALDRPGHVDARIQRATANLLDRICKRD